MLTVVFALLSTAYSAAAAGQTLNILTNFGAIPNDPSLTTARKNVQILSDLLNNNATGNTIYFPADTTFYLWGGIEVKTMKNAVIRIDSKLKFTNDDIDDWPYIPAEYEKNASTADLMSCFSFGKLSNVTFTSTKSTKGVTDRGIIDGGGPAWWGIPLFGYIARATLRPHLFHIGQGVNVTIENLVFKDSPRWTMVIRGQAGLLIRHCSIVARRTESDGHGLIDMSAFNTDGFDVSGHDIHIHDCDIWNQDDCIAVKDEQKGSYNMLFERINASGTGLVIGSIGNSQVRNITFRDSYLHRSFKGIFMKFRAATPQKPGLISDVLYENIIIDSAEQWPIWIGPAQQAISGNPCTASPCSLCWPIVPGAHCEAISPSTFVNITLRNITINNLVTSAGVVLGDSKNGFPIDGITFDSVKINNCHSSITVYDRVESFPGLLHPIDDGYVVRFHFAIFGFVLLFILSCFGCSCCCFTCAFRPVRYIKCRDPLAKKLENLPAFTVFLVAIVGIIITPVAVLVPGAVSTTDTAGYFVIDGVKNAVATGNTWPIPQGFVDRTTKSAVVDSCGGSAIVAPVTVCTLLAIVVVVGLLVWWRHRRLKMSRRTSVRVMSNFECAENLDLTNVDH